jgi:hypothetical protein
MFLISLGIRPADRAVRPGRRSPARSAVIPDPDPRIADRPPAPRAGSERRADAGSAPPPIADSERLCRLPLLGSTPAIDASDPRALRASTARENRAQPLA